MYNIILSAVTIAKDGIMIAVMTGATTGPVTGTAPVGTGRVTGLTTGRIISRNSATTVRHRHAIIVRHRFTAPVVMRISTGATTATGLTARPTIHSSRITARAASATHLTFKL